MMENIRDVFSNRIFRIPDYQRGYSWEKNHLDDFWQDINNLQKNKVHYTGMISVEEVDESEYCNWKEDLWLIQGKNEIPYYVVDGQQRLTTIIILIWCILDSIEDDEQLNYETKSVLINKYIFSENKQLNLKSYIFGYHKDNPSYEYLKKEIFEQEQDFEYQLEETTYTNNLSYTKSYFQKKINALTLEEKELLFQKLTLQLKFDFKILSKELDIFIVFETMNNRGKPLSNLERLKNRLIYLSTLIDESPENRLKLREDINTSWKIIYKYLGLNKENKLDDDSFLQNHWITFYRYERRESEFYANDIFNRVFTSQQVLRKKIGYKEIDIYITSIAEGVKKWFVMFNPRHPHSLELVKSPSLLFWLEKQNILGFKAFSPLIMSALLTDEDINNKIELVKSTEAYVFLLFHVSSRRSNTGTYHFNAKANELYNGTLTIEDIIVDLKLWIYGQGNIAGYFDEINFYNYLKDLFQRDVTNGYGDWGYLKYLLYEYELYLNNTKCLTDKSYKNSKVSNIAPLSNTKTCWKAPFSSFNKRQQKYILGSLGNFLLTEKNNNIHNNDICFDELRAILNKGFSNEREIGEFNSWDYNTILERGLNILYFFEKRWNVDLGNDSNKKSLLFLDFNPL